MDATRQSYALGLGRKSINLEIETEEGWKKIEVSNFGIVAAIGSQYSRFSVDWASIYLPMSVLPKYQKLTDGSDNPWKGDEIFFRWANQENQKVSFSLCKLRVKF